MGIPGIGTAFLSVLKCFFFLVALYFTIFFTAALIADEITITAAIRAAIVPIVSKTIFYASGVINGIIISIDK